MIVIELTAAVDAAGTLQTFYVSNEAYASKPTDTPPNTPFVPTIKDPGSIASTVFGDGQVIGATKLEVGEIVLSNADGRYDGWLDYGFDGRPVVIREGNPGAAYPGGFAVSFVGVTVNISADRNQLRIRVKDRQHLFEKAVLTTVYAGNNTLPNGVEGNANDIKGKVKPRVYGQVFNIRPPCVNTSKLTYQVSDGPVNSFDAVYDKALALTPGADYADLATLEAATPSGGTFITCKALGLFRLGGAPAGQVTADVTQGASSANRTVAQVLKSLALAAGISSGDIDSAAVTALDTLNSATVGIYLDDETTFLEAMDRVAKSLSVFYGFDSVGKFTMAQWLAPAGTSLLTIGEFYAGRSTERRPLKDVNVPVWKVAVSHSKNYTVQTSDVAGAVTQARRGVVGTPNVTETATDASVRTQFIQATALEVDSALVSSAAAAAEASRLLALHKVRRDAFEVPLPLQAVSQAGLVLGACVTLQISRFGLSGGKLMRILGIRRELAKNRAILTVWG